MFRLAGLPVAALLLMAGQAPESRELFAMKDHPTLKVMVPPEQADWCGTTANITIVAQSADQFTQEASTVQRIVGGVRAVLPFECPGASKIQVTGKVQGQPLYQAYALAANNWALEGAEIRSAEQLKLLADLETVKRCDELGASPDDPEAMTAGVADSVLNGMMVIEACGKAVAIDAETPRLKYQYARGLLKNGRDEDALEQLLPAAEAGHGGSLALLGDIHLNGAAGVEADPIAAKALYAKAAEARYEPARMILTKFEDQTAAVAQAEAEEKQAIQMAAQEQRQQAAAYQTVAATTSSRSSGALNTQGYEKPQFMSAIYAGDYDGTGMNRRVTQIYLVNMAEAMRQMCRGSFTLSELNGWRNIIMSEVDTSPEAGYKALENFAGMIAGISTGAISVAQVAAADQEANSLPQMAQEDAMTFLSRNSCGSAAFGRFTANMREAIK